MASPVEGPSGHGQPATRPPVAIAGVDASGNIRHLLLDSSGKLNLAASTVDIGEVQLLGADGVTLGAILAGGALKVDGSAVTQPVSGTVTGNQGTPAAAANAWPVLASNGTISAQVIAPADGLAVQNGLYVLGPKMLWTGASYDRARSTSAGDALNTGIQLVNSALWNGTNHDRARSSGIGDGNNTGVQMVNAGQYNGASIDRERGNWNTSTGDTGAKTVTFGGATQTNFNARGAMITVVLGTVTGTTPTMACQIQYSPDAGTTWIAYGAAMANLTTTGQTGAFNVYPDSGSPTTGATQTVNTNGPLPRTWRMNYVIGGTTPSFTITGVYVNYVV